MNLKELIRRIAMNRQEDFPFPDNLEDYLEDFIPNTLLKSETLQSAFGVSPYDMEEIYAEGYHLYTQEDYLTSATQFRWLVLLNPFEAKYWNGLAASLQFLKKYEKALHAYAMVALLESDNPYPHFHAFLCYELQGHHEEAQKALDLAHQRTLGQKSYHDLQEIISQYKRGDCKTPDPRKIDDFGDNFQSQFTDPAPHRREHTR